MRRHFRSSVRALLTCLTACAALPAATAEEEGEIVVFGRRQPAPLEISNAAGTNYNVRREDIERGMNLMGVRSVGELSRQHLRYR